MIKRTAVIMAGGSGERFWPLSRKKKPKQLLALASEKTMLNEAIDRIASLIPFEDTFIITSKILQEPIREALPMLPPENVIAEPYKRNTAPCLALAAAFIQSKYSDEYKTNEISVAVLTADQIISPVEGFIQTVKTSLEYVETNRVLATIGIMPSRPDTGFGYIEIGKQFKRESNSPEIQPVIRFLEKPNFEKAEEFVKTGRHLWNSGMFFWRLDTFIENLSQYLPAVGNEISNMSSLFKGYTDIAVDGDFKHIAPIFEKFPDISIDYALMEKADDVVVSKALFNWDDVGSWDSLDRVKDRDKNGNIIIGSHALHDVKNTVIFNSTEKIKLKIAAIGLDDFVIVATDDSILICPKNRVQEVKKCIEIIRNNNEEELL